MNAPIWTMESPPGAETTLNGRPYLYFAGTGYLGLQGHPALAAAARDAIDRYGIHTATSRGGFGTSPPVREVEQRAARFLGSRGRDLPGQRLCQATLPSRPRCRPRQICF